MKFQLDPNGYARVPCGFEGKHVRRFKDEKHESRKYEETNAWRTLKKKVQFGLPQTSVLHPSPERG